MHIDIKTWLTMRVELIPYALKHTILPLINVNVNDNNLLIIKKHILITLKKITLEKY